MAELPILKDSSWHREWTSAALSFTHVYGLLAVGIQRNPLDSKPSLPSPVNALQSSKETVKLVFQSALPSEDAFPVHSEWCGDTFSAEAIGES
jgi:hypothetical protein